MKLDLRVTIALLALIICPTLVLSCPRMQCAPIISKCQLIDACRCEAELDFSCYKNCSHCLGELYAECCSCVGKFRQQISPPTRSHNICKQSADLSLSTFPGVCPSEPEGDKSLESHVKMFNATNDELFDLFTSDGDYSERWHVHTLPAVSPTDTSVTTQCSMAFLSSCVDIYKCESSCIAMGAYGYRWFHIGCCECIGKYCPNFGINDIRCRDCPYESDHVIDSED